MKKFTQILALTLILSILIFILKYYAFFEEEKKALIEENFIDQSVIQIENNLKKDTKIDGIKEIETSQDKDLTSAQKYFFHYFPDYFKVDAFKYSSLLSSVLKSDSFNGNIIKLNLELYEKIIDVRGKMKNRTIKLFGVLEMEKTEFLSVFAHEFAHYVDIYFLEKKVLYDLSDYFYSISRESTKILKSSQTNKDFVSGYSMTNKYEDFAESYTYFIFHNEDFFKKTKKSKNLSLKYNFFEKYIFRNSEFKKTDFGEDNKIKDYYRDITKINFNLEIFLHYLKK